MVVDIMVVEIMVLKKGVISVIVKSTSPIIPPPLSPRTRAYFLCPQSNHGWSIGMHRSVARYRLCRCRSDWSAGGGG